MTKLKINKTFIKKSKESKIKKIKIEIEIEKKKNKPAFFREGREKKKNRKGNQQ
jgi:hypothetical protein